MVAFFEKIFGKKEVKKEEGIKLDFYKTKEWFENKTSEFLDSINKEIKKSFEQLENFSGKINKSLENLEKAEPEKEIEDRVRKIIQDNRIAFIKKTRNFTGKIKYPDTKNTPDVLEFYDVLIGNTNRLVVDTQKNIYFSRMLFPEKIAEIMHDLKNFTSTVNESQKTLNEDKARINLISKTSENIEKIKNLINTEKDENRMLEQNKQAFKNIENDEKNTQKLIDELGESSELTCMKKAEEHLEILNNKASEIKNNVLQMFFPLTKAFKKYERCCTEISKDEIKTLRLYIECPFKAVLIDRDFKTLYKILENTENLVKSGKINLKDKQKQKSLIQIDKLKNHSELNNFLAELENTKKSVEYLENKTKNMKINKEISSAKQKLAEIENTKEDKKEEINRQEVNLKNINQDISKEVKELETALRKISDKDVSVKLGS